MVGLIADLLILLEMAVPVCAFSSVAVTNPAPGETQKRGAEEEFLGTINEIKPDLIVVRKLSGKKVRVKITERTQYNKDGRAAKLTDFKVGIPILVHGETIGNDTFEAKSVATRSDAAALLFQGLGTEFVAGEVKSVAGTTLTVLRIDGATQQVKVDENTSFQKQGQSITLADIKSGDGVRARGSVKQGTFIAKQVMVGESD